MKSQEQILPILISSKLFQYSFVLTWRKLVSSSGMLSASLISSLILSFHFFMFDGRRSTQPSVDHLLIFSSFISSSFSPRLAGILIVLPLNNDFPSGSKIGIPIDRISLLRSSLVEIISNALSDNSSGEYFRICFMFLQKSPRRFISNRSFDNLGGPRSSKATLLILCFFSSWANF